MRAPRTTRPAKVAAVLYLAAFGLPAIVPLVAGLGHVAFHVGQAVQEARAFEDAFLAPSLEASRSEHSTHAELPGLRPSPHGPVGPMHAHRGPEGASGTAEVARHTHDGPGLEHTHGVDGREHSHNTLVDGALTLLGASHGDQVGPRVPASTVDNHVPATGADVSAPSIAVFSLESGLTTPPATPSTPLVPPPRA